jgi:hypothetical protein
VRELPRQKDAPNGGDSDKIQLFACLLNHCDIEEIAGPSPCIDVLGASRRSAYTKQLAIRRFDMKMLFATLAFGRPYRFRGLCGTQVLSFLRLPGLTIRQLRSTGRALLRLMRSAISQPRFGIRTALGHRTTSRAATAGQAGGGVHARAQEILTRSLDSEARS